MKTFLRFILLFSLIVWLGGIIFFSAIAAPATFQTMDLLKGGRPLAGELISRMLYPLHSMAQICAVIFLLTSIALHRKLRRIDHLFVVVMLALISVSQYAITPRIAPLRYDLAQKEDATKRAEFDKLHSMSVALEGTVLLLGLGVVWITVKEGERG